MKKRVAIIGAGVSGLPAIKCCLDEDLEPVCFERSGDIGGLWNYEEALRTPNMTSVMSSTVSNTSKEMSCYSDFPFPEEYPLFIPHHKMLTYLKLYAKEFDLVRHINLNTEVIKVRQTDDFTQTGNWSVTWKNLKTGEEKQETFNAVLMCSGAFSQPNETRYEGQEEFTGRIFHSRDYKSYHGLEKKTVVVVGMKNTGTDIATELSGLGSQVYLSSRRSTWMVCRLPEGGMGARLRGGLSSRSFLSIFQSMPVKYSAKMLRNDINKHFNHALYGMEPTHYPGLESGSITINDILPDRIISGRVVIKPNIRRFTETSVVFEDDSVVENVDTVILATGYSLHLPYLDCDEFGIKNGSLDLYKTMFAPSVHPSTIALIGGPFLVGGVVPYSEMQCRVATRVIKGDVKLPNESEMWREIRAARVATVRRKRQLNYEGPDGGDGGSILEFYLPVMTTLSSICGCRPSFFKLLWMDRRLAWHYLFEPPVPAQFRLCGHGAWSGAAEAVLSSSQRAMCAFPPTFQLRSSENKSKNCLRKALSTFLVLTPLLCFVLYSSKWTYYFVPDIAFGRGNGR